MNTENGTMFINVLLWVISAFVMASLSNNRQISYAKTFALSFFLSPVVAAAYLFFSGKKEQRIDDSRFSLASEELGKNNPDLAVEILEQILTTKPTSYLAHYNLSCIFSLKEDKIRSFFHLQRAVECGFADFSEIQSEDDLLFLRNQPEFKMFVLNGYKISRDIG